MIVRLWGRGVLNNARCSLGPGQVWVMLSTARSKYHQNKNLLKTYFFDHPTVIYKDDNSIDWCKMV